MTKNNFAKIIPEFRKYKKWTKIYLLITFLVILILAGILTFVKIQRVFTDFCVNSFLLIIQLRPSLQTLYKSEPVQ
ncbi:hypothetical protein, partial [Williamsoniiplasma lucivorax]|uniref:hypothetical protein n=1 Tax=Williamsoniiplasma lucivorax TaxID=209274 RepID=UPI001B7F9F27